VEEVSAVRRGDAPAVARSLEITFADLVERYLAQHEAEDVTIARLRTQLRPATAVFGDRPIRTLQPDELGAWKKTLTGNRHHVFRALKQVLAQAERWEWIDKSPARYVKNPKPKAPEITPFRSWAELDAIAEELDPRYAAIPSFAAGTGLRPEEWLALTRADLDRAAGVVHVRRVYSQGHLKECAKTSRQRAVSRSASASSTPSKLTRRDSIHPCCSPLLAAATSSLESGGSGTGSQRFELPASPTGGFTITGTATRRGALRPASRCSRCPGGWAPLSR
jgi:integrase